MEKAIIIKALSDDTRMKIVTLLLRHNYCVRALARSLELTEATISQHLKVLKEAGLLIGERRGYFMHYDVRRDVLKELAVEVEKLAAIERKPCTSKTGDCKSKQQECNKKNCSKETQEFCHGALGGGEYGDS